MGGDEITSFGTLNVLGFLCLKLPFWSIEPFSSAMKITMLYYRYVSSPGLKYIFKDIFSFLSCVMMGLVLSTLL